MQRRTLLFAGAAAAGVVVIGGGSAARMLLAKAPSPNADEAGYARLLADVRDDYINGRVVEHEGWVLSQHEFDSLDTRVGSRATTPGLTSIS